MENYQFEQPTKKRVLKKLRVQFLNKTPSEENIAPLEYTHHFIDNKNTYILNRSIGLVEVDRKIHLAVKPFNSFVTFNAAVIKEDSKPGCVMLNPLSFAKVENLPSLEHLVKRLESFGDLDLATWAHRIKKFNEMQAQTIVRYFEANKPEDLPIQQKLLQMRRNAMVACREIEARYPFRRVVTFTKEDSTEFLSVTYSEDILEELGFTLEEFEMWSKKNGLPSYLAGDSNIQMDLAKYLLGCTLYQSGKAVNERPEFVTYIIDKDGNKKPVVAQHIYIFDPQPEGFFLYGYFIIKKDLPNNVKDEGPLNLKAYKESNLPLENDQL